MTGNLQEQRIYVRFVRIMHGLSGVIVFLTIWQLVVWSGMVNPAYLPLPTDVIIEFYVQLNNNEFWAAIGNTLRGWIIGLSVAVGAGTVFGLVIGSSRLLRAITYTTIEFLRPIPSVALIPLVVLLYGVDIESKLFLIIYASFWQVLIQMLYGVADVDPVAQETARSFGLSRNYRLRYVIWPTALPYLMTGVRLGASVALILAVTAELVIGNPGLGLQISLAQSGNATVEMYALVLTTGFIGVLINFVFRTTERKILSWHPSIRNEANKW